MAGTALTFAEFNQELAGAEASAKRWEAQDGYAVSVEAHDFELFRAGMPRPPEQLEWWTPWIEQIADQHARGVTVERVAVEDDPPTLYQRWRKGAAWRAEKAGERIYWIAAALAADLGLSRKCDWWLIDNIKVIVMEFNSAHEMISRTLITDPAVVSRYREMWDLVTRNNAAVEHSTAA